MNFANFDPHSFGRGFTVGNLLSNMHSPGPGSYNPSFINKKSKNNDWMFRKKTSRKINENELEEIHKKNLPKNTNYEPVDFYNVQEKYVNESKKPRIPKYSFSKASRIEVLKKNKNNISAKKARPKSTKIVKKFEEEKNSYGDNVPNNIKFKEEKIEGDKSQNINKNKNKKEEDLEEENGIPGVGKYNIRGSLKVPVVKFGTEKKGLYFDNIVSPGPAKYNLMEKEFGKNNTKYSIPKGPRGLDPRPFTPGPGKYDPNLAQTKESSYKYSFPKDKRLHYPYNNNPAPNRYNTARKFGEDAKKISISPCGRQPTKYNDFPGPNKYHPDYKVLKLKYPKYRIGTAKRKEIYATNPSFPAPNRYNVKINFSSRKPKSSTWIFGKEYQKLKCRPPLFSDRKTPGVGMYSLRNNKNSAPKYTLRGKYDIKDKEKRPGVGQYNVGKSSKVTMKKEPTWKIGKASRDDLLTNDKRGNPGPGLYRVPCSIVDVNDYTREQGNFDNHFKFI